MRLLGVLFFLQSFAENVPFGDRLGTSHGVDGFSNFNNTLISEEDNYVNGVFMGMKWQCVEYARRFLYETKGIVFDSVEGATDIWGLSSVRHVSRNQLYELIPHTNGQADRLPQEGDLLIWPRQGTDTPFGHVAVVVGSVFVGTDMFISLAEQNFLNEPWEDPEQYARRVRVLVTGLKYSVMDPGYQVKGWMSIGGPIHGPEATKPNAANREWDTSTTVLVLVPIVITVVGIMCLAYVRRKEGRGARAGHLLLDDDEADELPPRVANDQKEAVREDEEESSGFAAAAVHHRHLENSADVELEPVR